MLLTVLVVLLIFAFLGGGVGYSRYGSTSWSPAGLLLLLLILYLIFKPF